jgi:hypothetical protein
MLDQLTSEPGLRYFMIGFVVLCAAMAFLRGLGRLILFGIALAAGAAAALAWFQFMPALCIAWFKSNPPEFVQWGAVAAGLLVAWLTRRFTQCLVSGEGPGEMDRRTRVRGGLLGLIPAFILLWAGAVVVRWMGTAARLRQVEQAVDAQDVSLLENEPLLARLGRSLMSGTLGEILNRIDPLGSREAGAAATLLVLQRRGTDGRNPVWERARHHPQAAR